MYHYFVTSYMMKQPIFVIYNVHVSSHVIINLYMYNVHTSGFQIGSTLLLWGGGGGGLVCSPRKCFKFRPSEVDSGATEGL